MNATDRNDYRGPVFINPGKAFHLGIGHSSNGTRWSWGVWSLLCQTTRAILPGGSWEESCEVFSPCFTALLTVFQDIISFDPRGGKLHHTSHRVIEFKQL